MHSLKAGHTVNSLVVGEVGATGNMKQIQPISLPQITFPCYFVLDYLKVHLVYLRLVYAYLQCLMAY